MEVLQALCSEDFYAPCVSVHEKQKYRQAGENKRLPLYNLFCTDCTMQLCSGCQSPHDGHTLLQVSLQRAHPPV
jgi:hypothetical protein